MTPRPALLRPFVGEQGLRAGVRFLLFLGLLLAAQWIVQVGLVDKALGYRGSQWIQLPDFLYAEIAGLVVVLAVTWLLARSEGRTLASFGLPLRAPAARRFAEGTAWGLAAPTLLVAMIAVAGGARYDGLALSGGALLAAAAGWTVTFLLLGIYEEALFRGYPLWTLARGMGFWSAAVFLSLLFAAAHFFFKPHETWVDAASVGLIGLFLCLTIRLTGTLWFAAGFHFAFDWAALFLYGAPNSGNDGRSLGGHLLAVRWTGPAWLTGGPLGIEASALAFPVIAALFVLFPLVYRKSKGYVAATTAPTASSAYEVVR